VLQPKGWITATRYMYALAYTIRYDVIKKLHKMSDKMQL